MNSQTPHPSSRVIVIWQSLVVSSYRSFFQHFVKTSRAELVAVVPEAFSELGGQHVPCAPFSDAWKASIETHILKVDAPHVQCVWFRGLWRIFWREKKRSQPEERAYVVAFMEPYSLSALFVLIIGTLFLPSHYRLIFYSAQNLKKRFALPMRLIQNLVFRRAAAIMSLSSEVTQVLRDQGYTGKILPFPLWADSSLFRILPSEHKQQNSDHKMVIGYCGAVTESKGIPDLLEALHTLAPEELSRLAFEAVGTGPLLEDLKRGLEPLQKVGLTSIVHGPRTAQELPEILNRWDVLVIPSRTETHWKEQFGRVIIEAWACGAAVLGSDSGEIPNLVQDTTFVFRERNPASLAEKLRHLMKNPSLLGTRPMWHKRAHPYLDVQAAESFSKRMFGESSQDESAHHKVRRNQ